MSVYINERLLENEKLIYKIASKYSSYYDVDDLYQAGCMGLIKADKKFNESHDTKFSTYAYKYILGEIIDFIRKDKNIVISEEAYDLYKKYLKIRELLYKKYEKEPSFDDICSYMEIDSKYLLRIIESIGVIKSINEDERIFDCLNSNEDVDMKIMIKNEIDALDEVSKSIIDYRYYKGYSQMETAQIMGLSQSKVSREEKLILKQIKDNIAI